MKTALALAVVSWCALFALACGSADKGSGTPAASGAGGDGSGTTTPGAGGDQTGMTADACHDGCVETLAAKCSNGPTDQASCESTCHSLESGKCGGEYATFQGCAGGKALTCSAQGLPIVEACSDQQAAFVACLNP
jgi:hypothetical protein